MNSNQPPYPPNMPPQDPWGQQQYGYPQPGPPQYNYPQPGPSYPYGPTPDTGSKKTKIVLIVILALLLIGGAGAAIFILKKDDNKTDAKAEVIKGDSYTAEIPPGMSQQEIQEDTSIPSDLDFRLELTDEIDQGGVISIGRVAGELEGKSAAEIGDMVEETYNGSYGNQPGSTVEKESLTIDGHDASVVKLQFPNEVTEGVTIFARVHFIATDTDKVVYLSCDWNDNRTKAIAKACDNILKSIKITS